MSSLRAGTGGPGGTSIRAEVTNTMSRSTTIRRWTAASLLTAAVGLGAAGCVAVPVGGGYGGYGDPAVVVPAPGVVITPPPVVFGPGYYGHRHGWRRGYSNRGYDRRG